MAKFDQITEAGISDLVTRFYAKVRCDLLIGPLFNRTIDDWDAHLAKLSAFWSSVMLTSGRYKGNPMVAHMKHAIGPEFSIAGWRCGAPPRTSFSCPNAQPNSRPRRAALPKA